MNETTRLFSEHGLAWWHLLVAGGLLAVMAWQIYRWLRLPIPPARRRILIAMRVTWVVLLAWCLWNPAWERVWEIRREVRPTVSVVVDHSRSMVAGRTDEGAARWQDVRATVSAIDRRLGAARVDDVRWYALGDRVQPWSADLKADAETSPIIAGLGRIANERASSDRPHRILLISDGADTDEAEAELFFARKTIGQSAGESATASSTTIYPIILRDGATSPRLGRFTRVVTPSAVPLRTRLTIDAAIRLRGHDERPVTVILEQDGRELDRRLVSGRDGTAQVTLNAPAATRAGLQRLTLRLRDQDGERDRAEAIVAVVAETGSRVLWVQGGLGWEYRFVRGAVEANRSLILDGLSRLDERRFLRQYTSREPGTATAVSNGGSSSGSGSTAGDAMAELRTIMKNYSVVVLADCPPSLVDDATQQALAEAVRTRGLGILFMTGDAAQAAAWRSSRLETLLPVRFAEPGDPAVVSDVETRRFLSEVRDYNMLEREARYADDVVERQRAAGGPLADLTAMRLTTAGRSSPIWRQGESAIGTVLADPPKTFRFSAKADRAKPGATVLAEHPVEHGTTGPRPLLAVQEVDGGRAAFLGVDGLWRWRMQTAASARDYDRFWQQLLLWLGAQSASGGQLSADRAEYRPGESIVLRATGSGALSSTTAELVVRSSAGDERTMPLTRSSLASAASTGDAASALIPTFASTTWIEAEWRQDGKTLAAIHVPVRATGLEDDYCQLDRPRLEALAAVTGGQVIDATDLRLIDAVVAPEIRFERRRETRSLWHLQALFWLMLAVYAVELLLRRRWLLT